MKHISKPLNSIMTSLILLGNCPDDVLWGTPYEYLIALREFLEKSQRDIAEQVGCSKTYVLNIKNEVVSSDHLHPSSIPGRLVGKDVKSYLMMLMDKIDTIKKGQALGNKNALPDGTLMKISRKDALKIWKTQE